MAKIIHLDLDVIVIKGFERLPLGVNGELVPAVSDRVIEEVIKGIHAGAEFSPVIIEPDYDDKTAFKLSWAYNKERRVWEGRHVRTIAHFIEGVPLRCRWVTDEDYVVYPISAQKLTQISNYLILDDSLFAEKGIGLERRKEVWKLGK